MPSVFTTPGGSRPREPSPSLLFHKLHAYDRFHPEVDHKGGVLDPFVREEAQLELLEGVAARASAVNREHYRDWHTAFARACGDLGARTLTATTWWRLVVGWATNPALEIGLELDRFLGFPFLPGSAVKGLLHHEAEMALMEPIRKSPPPPDATAPLPAKPPETLGQAIARALRVRLLFGSLSAERTLDHAPETPREHLEPWLRRLQAEETLPATWVETLEGLRLLLGSHTGGLLTCFDAVPSVRTAKGRLPMLAPDILTPHPPHTESDRKGPNPNVFLAVEASVELEFRFRVARVRETGKPRDADEAERRRLLDGTDRQTLGDQVEGWLRRASTERGAGAKTSAGYGYFYTGARPTPPDPPERPAAPSEPTKATLSPEAYAEQVLPVDLDLSDLANRLDLARQETEPERRKAVGRRFAALYREQFEDWRRRTKKTRLQDRLRDLGLLEEDGDDS